MTGPGKQICLAIQKCRLEKSAIQGIVLRSIMPRALNGLIKPSDLSVPRSSRVGSKIYNELSVDEVCNLKSFALFYNDVIKPAHYIPDYFYRVLRTSAEYRGLIPEIQGRLPVIKGSYR